MRRSIVVLAALVVVFVFAFAGSALAFKPHTAPDVKSSTLSASSAPGFWKITVRWDTRAGRPEAYAVTRAFNDGGMSAGWYLLKPWQTHRGRLVVDHLSGVDVYSFQVGLSNRWATDWGRVLLVP